MENSSVMTTVTEEGWSEQIRYAVKDALPLVIGFFPFGITCGLMGITAGLTSWETIAMSIFVFAGAAQFIAITMIGSGAVGLGLLVFTTLLVNLRHLLMGASLAPHLVKLPKHLQMLLSFWMTDEAYVVTTNRIQTAGYDYRYHTAVSGLLYAAWVLFTIVGVAAGSYIPNPLAWGLDFAMPVTFLVMLAPRLTDKVGRVVGLVSAVVAVLGSMFLPGKWYIIAACVAACLAGGLMEGENSDAK